MQTVFEIESKSFYVAHQIVNFMRGVCFCKILSSRNGFKLHAQVKICSEITGKIKQYFARTHRNNQSTEELVVAYTAGSECLYSQRLLSSKVGNNEIHDTGVKMGDQDQRFHCTNV